MRKLYYTLLVAILAVSAGCQKDESVMIENGKSYHTIYAAIDDDEITRTSLNENNDVLWSANDQISAFMGSDANCRFILQDGAGEKFGTFTNVPSPVNETAAIISANVAYYPYDDNATVSENNGIFTVSATFPATQTFSASGTFGSNTSPMMAVTESTSDNEFKFKNVGSIFRLQLKGTAKITKIEFSATASLAGECNITASNTIVPSVNVTNGSKTIVLNCGTGVQLNAEVATDFIVAMLPVENLTGGITISIYDNVGKKMVYTHKGDEAINFERSKAYTTASITYNGNESATPDQQSAQQALDNAVPGTVIQLQQGVDYGTLVFRRNSSSKVVDITYTGGDAPGNEHYSRYEYITILGAPGATLDQIDFEVGWIAGSGANYVDINNLTVRGVTFTGDKTAFNLEASKGSALGIDGLTIDNCSMTDANGTNRLVFQQITGYELLKDKTTSEDVMTTGIKNLTINDCKITGAYMVIESRAMENLTITNNSFNNIQARDMLITSDVTNYPDEKYTGTITITGNTSTGGKERFIRASLNNSESVNVTIRNNTINNYQGADADWIKVTESSGTLSIGDNTFTVTNTEALKTGLKNAPEGTVIKLSEGTYDEIAYTDPKNYNAKNLTIMGEGNVTLNGFTIGEWAEDAFIIIDGLTFKNINFSKGILLSTNKMQNITVENCNFSTDACIKQNQRKQQLKSLVVKGCTFSGDLNKSHLITALMLENTHNLTVTECNFSDIDYNVLQGYLTGTIKFDQNTINKTGDRVFRFVNSDNVDITISNNIITSDGDESGELAKSSNPILITLTNNRWNGKTDAEVADKLINITAKN